MYLPGAGLGGFIRVSKEMNIFYFILISGLLTVGSSAVSPRSKGGGPYGHEKKYEAEPVRLRKEWCV
jgi:hypothetical protein